ncbi:MAG: NAD-dependent epimerase/dehydratase family protein [Phycisphaeraceae bacterium]|nr:NAD-dependent epimerase/dehydratase family protein [Phycisphaeraceae bacterium]
MAHGVNSVGGRQAVPKTIRLTRRLERMMPDGYDWSTKRVIVTGGAGFAGRAVCRVLRGRGVREDRLFVPLRRDYDLTDPAQVGRMYRESFRSGKADVVIHAAGAVGGIGANLRSPGRFFHANMAMALHLIEGARVDGLPEREGVFVQVGSMCSYPAHAPMPLREDDLWSGFPEPSHAPYGIAKLAAGLMLDAYRREYGMRGAFVLPINLYGPGDNFDPESSHVVAALVRRCVEARDRDEPRLTCWGTGNATREFLYVDDAAEGIVRAAEVMHEPTPINLGPGVEVSIRELVGHIVRTVGYTGQVEWDTTKPEGQPRRCLDTARAAALLGWKAKVGLEEGLRRTVEWYEAQGQGK